MSHQLIRGGRLIAAAVDHVVVVVVVVVVVGNIWYTFSRSHLYTCKKI